MACFICTVVIIGGEAEEVVWRTSLTAALFFCNFFGQTDILYLREAVQVC